MTSQTTKYVIPYPQAGDTIAGLAATIQNLAQRVDLLLGESGTWSPNLAANTPTTVNITLSRAYPGNAVANPNTAGIVVVQCRNQAASGVNVQTYVNSFTGTSTTVTGFTLGATASVAAVRDFTWRFIPLL